MVAVQMTLKNDMEFRKFSDSGLKKLVTEICGVELPQFDDATDGKFFDELNPDDFETIRYACTDSDFALRLYLHFNGWFDKNLPKHQYIVEQIETPTAVYCGLMKYKGITLDIKLMQEKRNEDELQIHKLKENIEIMTDGVDISANASTKDFKITVLKVNREIC